MPLSPPAARETLHHRRIAIVGYRRDDGLFDIEAHLTDTKTYAFPNENRGTIEAGEPLHEMWLRLTLSPEMRIQRAEAATDHGPYGICPSAAPGFAALEGLTIGPGFLKAARQAVGGTSGCTHLRELLQQIATTAFQTIKPARAAAERPAGSGEALDARISQLFGGPRAVIDTCLAYASDGPIVRRRWPELYTGR